MAYQEEETMYTMFVEDSNLLMVHEMASDNKER